VVIFRSQKGYASKNVWETHHLELQISKSNRKFGGMGLFDRGYGPVTRCCEHGNAPLGSETSSRFINSLRGGGAASCVTAVTGKRIVSGQFLLFKTWLSVFVNVY